MKKHIIISFILFLILFLTFIIFSQQEKVTGFSIYDSTEEKLENLRAKINVECLKNSQCQGGFECIENRCLPLNEIYTCEKAGLSTNVRTLSINNELNIAKRVLTKKDLPYLLSDGKIVDIVEGEVIEYHYSPVILIGDNKIRMEDAEYFIELKKEPVYTYQLLFSNPIDFSDKDIQGQSLRILGDEYIIGEKF